MGVRTGTGMGIRLGVLTTMVAAGAAWADVKPHAGMLQNPDISAEHIVFAYANNLWLAPRMGGTASPVAGPPGPVAFPRFSPDGKTLAFVGNYEGNRDLYTIPTVGGVPQRVTYHPAAETLCDWTPDGKLIYFVSGTQTYPRAQELFVIDAGGGLREKLPVPYGANGAISADGQWLAYTPNSRDTRTWKRYRGGMASDVWLFNLRTNQSRRATDWEGTDSQPMWHGGKVYYLSDNGPEHRLNIWVHDPSTGRNEQVTRFTEFDVKWPAVGPGANGGGEIVFQFGSELRVLDLATRQSRSVEIIIPGDRPKLRSQIRDAADNMGPMRISSTGKRAVLEARGEVWTAPARYGSARNLTRTNGVAERDPSWSPDGRWIAYFSDEDGEYALYRRPSSGLGEPERLSTDGEGYLYRPTWSPDSKHIYYCDKTGSMFLHTLGTGTKKFDVEPWAGQPAVSWSSDSRWLAYTVGLENTMSAVILYDVENGRRHQVTSGVFSDSHPTFDREGKYLYLASHREFSSPVYQDLGGTFVYVNSDRLYVVPLRDDVPSPFAPRSDEEKWDDEDDGDGSKEKKDVEDKEDESEAAAEGESESAEKNDDEESAKDDKDDVKPIQIDLEGFERRMIPLPIDGGAFWNLAVNSDNHLLYVRGQSRGMRGDATIKIIDVTADEPKEEQVAEAGGFDMSADGKKILVYKGRQSAIVDAKKDQKLDKPMRLAGLEVEIDPRVEWAQIFHEAWRVQRDFFYDPTMHGVDWKQTREQYAAMLADCVSREDVSYVIREMIAELNVGHAYYWGGDVESEPSRSVGMPGCDFELHDGAYHIARIYEGATWDADARGPLSQPNVDVKVGDYLLAVNGAPVDASRSPWAAFQGMADKVVTLMVSDQPTLDSSAREVIVQLPGSEYDLRYRAWIEDNRRYVEEKSGGKVGYIYVPDTGVNGQNNLFRQFYGQINREALIIDERWNGGGQIPDRFIELLNRPVRNYWARRDGRDWRWPPDSHQGPKCMLINGLAGSGGDCFPYYFRQSGLGPLIGTRTWGGLVGISGNPNLIDGGYTSAPTFAFYENDGTWGVEGHGVDPDIEVVDDPALMVGGKDPQLDRAITEMLAAIEREGFNPPSRPRYPDRRGMGIAEEDK